MAWTQNFVLKTPNIVIEIKKIKYSKLRIFVLNLALDNKIVVLWSQYLVLETLHFIGGIFNFAMSTFCTC